MPPNARRMIVTEMPVKCHCCKVVAVQANVYRIIVMKNNAAKSPVGPAPLTRNALQHRVSMEPVDLQTAVRATFPMNAHQMYANKNHVPGVMNHPVW